MNLKQSRRITIIEPQKRRWQLPNVGELWRYGYLSWLMVISEIKAKYRQTLVGPAWHFINLIITTLVFTLVFGNFLNVTSQHVPYAIFVMSGVSIWQIFQRFVSEGTSSLVTMGPILSKVHLPHLLIPLRTIGLIAIDSLFTIILLLGLSFYFGIVPSMAILLAPVFWLLAVLLGLAIIFWLSVLNVTYRDISIILGSVLQGVFWLTPIIYPTEMVGEKYSWLINLNPLMSIIEGFRWTLIGTPPPSPGYLLYSVVVILIILIPGAMFFTYSTRTMVDRL